MSGNFNNPSDFINNLFECLEEVAPKASEAQEEINNLKEEIKLLRKESQRKAVFEEVDRNQKRKAERIRDKLNEGASDKEREIHRIQDSAEMILEDFHRKLNSNPHSRKRATPPRELVEKVSEHQEPLVSYVHDLKDKLSEYIKRSNSTVVDENLITNQGLDPIDIRLQNHDKQLSDLRRAITENTLVSGAGHGAMGTAYGSGEVNFMYLDDVYGLNHGNEWPEGSVPVWDGTQFVPGTGPQDGAQSVLSLGELTDVADNVSDVAEDGDVLTWDGTQWVAEEPAQGVQYIYELDDVADSVATPQSGDILVYDGTQWVAEQPPEGVQYIYELDDVADSVQGAQAGDVLVYDGTQWVAEPAAEGVQYIYELDDVADSVASAEEGDILVYDGTQWVAKENQGAQFLWELDDVDDAIQSGVQDNSVLKFDAAAPLGSQWKAEYQQASEVYYDAVRNNPVRIIPDSVRNVQLAIETLEYEVEVLSRGAILAGTYYADVNQMQLVTAAGFDAGFRVGNDLLPPSSSIDTYYVYAVTDGLYVGAANGPQVSAGDYIICNYPPGAQSGEWVIVPSGVYPVEYIWQLDDVADGVQNSTEGDILIYDGTQWVSEPYTGSQYLWELDDVSDTVTGAQAGEALVWDGTQWVAEDVGAKVITATSAPTNAEDGDLWWNENNGTLYIYYCDVDSCQWVQAVPTGDAGAQFIWQLDDVADGVQTSAALGDALIWDGTQWVSGQVSGVQNLWQLEDVSDTIVGAQAGDVLVYDGTQWVSGTISAGSVYVSDSAPIGTPAQGDLWWDSDRGQMFVYYQDGSSSQWVVANGPTVGPQGPMGPQGLIVLSNPPGSIMMMGSSTPPSGYLLCDGSAVSRSTYSDLFSAIGTIHGVGDGSTTFNLPDLTDKFADELISFIIKY